jgi:hypothetical protein
MNKTNLNIFSRRRNLYFMKRTKFHPSQMTALIGVDPNTFI